MHARHKPSRSLWKRTEIMNLTIHPCKRFHLFHIPIHFLGVRHENAGNPDRIENKPMNVWKYLKNLAKGRSGMNLRLNLFPGGVSKALTLSYDDGVHQDRRLVEIMNRHRIRGTFHLNSGFLDHENHITAAEVPELYQGHEVSVHTRTHPFLERIPREGVLTQILQDRSALEELASYPVRGMSYPYGTYNADVLALLPALGIEYSRTVKSHGQFTLPDNWLEWHPTCHHNDMMTLGKSFLELTQVHPAMQLLYVWGHSYEFDRNNNWEEFESFCEMMGGREDLWYATNIEIVDYLHAVRQLRFSASQALVYNPSSLDVWISVSGEPCRIPGGRTVSLG